MKHIPNLLSCMRIALSVAMLFFSNYPAIFIALFLACGFSDIADGYIARRYDAVSALGARLDTLGDLVFFAVMLYLVFPILTRAEPIILWLTVLVSVIRLLNSLVTKLKFKRWEIMHTLGNKASGVGLFLLMPVCIALDAVPLWPALGLCSVALLSALEESLIILTNKSYAADQKSIFQ